MNRAISMPYLFRGFGCIHRMFSSSARSASPRSCSVLALALKGVSDRQGVAEPRMTIYIHTKWANEPALAVIYLDLKKKLWHRQVKNRNRSRCLEVASYAKGRGKRVDSIP